MLFMMSKANQAAGRALPAAEKGSDREEYAKRAASERMTHRLQGDPAGGLRKVALEPET